MKKVFTHIAVCAAGGITIILVLSFISQHLQQQRNNFLRILPTHAIEVVKEFNLGLNSYYIAGGTPNRIYLGNHTAPLHVLMVSKNSDDTIHYDIEADDISNEKFWSLRLEVDSPSFILHDGAVPRIYAGSVSYWHASRLGFDTEFFLDIEHGPADQFLIKSIMKNTKESVLGNVKASSPHYTFHPEVLQKQIDGFFCTDGYLRYNHSFNRIVYTYRYRNEFITLDSNFTVLYRGQTLDSNRVAKIKVATIASSDSRVLSAPPLVINNRAVTDGPFIFINSALRAKNEQENALDIGSVVDVFSLHDGRYILSFYIPDFQRRERLKDFRVYGRTLIALFDTHLEFFEMDQELFAAQHAANTP